MFSFAARSAHTHEENLGSVSPVVAAYYLADFFTGNQLLKHCEADTTEDGGMSGRYCLGYLLGIAESQDMAAQRARYQEIPQGATKNQKAWWEAQRALWDDMLSKSLCLPGGVTAKQVRLVFLNWARKNLAELHSGANKLVQKAFIEAWSCR